MPRFTFKKSERLCSLKAIEFLFHHGSSLQSPGYKFIYVLHDQPQPAPCQVVFSVPKRSFKKAVERNLLKRRMRESYRLHKDELYKSLMEHNKNMHLLVIYTSREVMEFEETRNSLLKGLKSLVARVQN